MHSITNSIQTLKRFLYDIHNHDRNTTFSFFIISTDSLANKKENAFKRTHTMPPILFVYASNCAGVDAVFERPFKCRNELMVLIRSISTMLSFWRTFVLYSVCVIVCIHVTIVWNGWILLYLCFSLIHSNTLDENFPNTIVERKAFLCEETISGK